MKYPIYLRDMWIDPLTNRISHTRAWNNVACFMATVFVCHKEFYVTGGLSIEFFQWYLGLVGFQVLASKFLSLKLGGGAVDTTTTRSSSDTNTTTTSVSKEKDKENN